jgi:hypothetical protein
LGHLLLPVVQVPEDAPSDYKDDIVDDSHVDDSQPVIVVVLPCASFQLSVVVNYIRFSEQIALFGTRSYPWLCLFKGNVPRDMLP